MGDISIRDGLEHMDFARVTDMLSRAYWSPGIKIGEVKQGAANSALVVGAFAEGNKQVGYARVISDKTRFGYISDVYVDEAYRKMGIAQRMMSHILSHDSLRDVYQWVLRTADAQALYSKVGFSGISQPERWMEIRRNRPDR